MKTVLITGGSGFIGSNLIRQLLSNKENKIICIDNNYTGSLENIKPFLHRKNFKFIKHDISKPFKINEKIDEIYNLACPASPKYHQRPLFTLNTSVLGIINILKLAKKNNAKVIQTSTSEIYGNPLEHPQKETYWGNVNTIGVRSCYDEGKRVAETYCYEYWKKYSLDVRMIRIFNTYGPNMLPKDGRVISNFIVQALKNKALTVYGDGTQTRSFQYIDDLINAILKYMRMDKERLSEKFKNLGWYTIPVLNIGNPKEIKIIELANEIKNLIPKSKSKIIFKPLPEDDPVKRKPDITLAKKILNWKPETGLKEGLKKTITYFKKIT